MESIKKEENSTPEAKIDPNKFIIREEDIINKEYYKSICDVGIMCTICQNIAINPITCSKCQNSFCKECIDEFKKKGTECPFRCTGATQKPNRVMRSVLSKLKIKCRRGCGEELSYSDYENHFMNACSKIDFKVKYEMEKSKNEKLTEQLKEIQKLKEENESMKKKIEEFKPTTTIVKFIDFDMGIYKSSNHKCDLTLIDNPIGFTCSKCKVKYNNAEELKKGFGCSYNCSKCKYDLCINCHFSEIEGATFTSKKHKHPLKYIWKDHYVWICDICKSEHKETDGCFCCMECKYDLCKSC
ncbi:MAG: hypothetical protein MJ252_24475, partial [archaeon]|nr:hypothetical protein [archaeon]